MFPTPGQQDWREASARIARLGVSERCQQIDRLERFWTGHAYDGRPSFWNRDEPLQSRAPVVIDPVLRIAGERLAGMVFGERKFPAMSVAAGKIGAGDLALSEQDAAELSKVVTALATATALRMQMQKALLDGLKSRTAVLVATLRGGRLHVDTLPAKWCTPTFASGDTEQVTELDYRYRHAENDADGTERHYWFRRLITQSADTKFAKVEARDDGREPAWVPESSIPVEFCAVEWARNQPDTTCHNDYDGVALGEGLEDEIEALDLELSMIHRNALYNGDPLPYVTGASPEDVIAERTQPKSRDPFEKPAQIAKSPGSVLWIPEAGASVGALEAGTAGAEILHRSSDRIRRMILDCMHVVLADPEKLGSGDLSARSLTILFQSMIDYCDGLRETWGRVLARVVSKLLRLLVTSAAIAGGVLLPGVDLDAVRPILQRFLVTYADGSTRWVDPALTLKWGPYFEPSQAEIQAAVGAATQATGGKPVLSRKRAVEMLAPIAGVSDVAAELRALDDADGAEDGRTSAMLDKLNGPAPTGETADVQKTALNGAQVTSLVAVVQAVAAGTLPRNSGVQIISLAFQVTPEDADRLMGDAGKVPAAPVVANAATPGAAGAQVTHADV